MHTTQLGARNGNIQVTYRWHTGIIRVTYRWHTGAISKKKISYSANAPRGSRRNPFIKEGDLITVTSSVLSKTADVIKEITAPFVGIYSTKQLIEDF